MLGWCSRCYQVSPDDVGDDRDAYFEGYLPCHFCSGVSLPLPRNFARYAGPALDVFTTQPMPAGQLLTLAAALGQARAECATPTPGQEPVATVLAIASGLEDVLRDASENADLGAALLSIWILVGELRLMAELDPRPASLDEWRGAARLRSLTHVITA